MDAYRYIVNEHGGIVFAIDESEAKAKVKRYSILMNDGYALSDDDVQVWKYENDDYYCSEVPDVYDCYG